MQLECKEALDATSGCGDARRASGRPGVPLHVLPGRNAHTYELVDNPAAVGGEEEGEGAAARRGVAAACLPSLPSLPGGKEPDAMQMSLAPPPGHAMPPVTEQRQTGGGVRLRQMNAPPQQKKAYAFQHPLLAVPMVCIVTVLFGWSWYVHVLIMDAGLLRDGGSGVVLGAVDVAVWHVILLFAYTSYLQTVLTQPGYTTTGRGAHSLAALEAGLTPAQRDARYCTTCCSYKPQRCHHCRMCGRCVEKMDHHCPWVANCVGKYNHKFFVLFVLYSAFTALYNAGTLGVCVCVLCTVCVCV